MGAARCFFYRHFADVCKMATEWWPRPGQASIFAILLMSTNRGLLGYWMFRTAKNFLVIASCSQNVTDSLKSQLVTNRHDLNDVIKMVLIRPNSADLDYVFQQSGNKSREVVFNSGEFARIRLICAFFCLYAMCKNCTFLFRWNSTKLNSLKLQEIKTPEFGGIKINQHSMILRIPALQTVRAAQLIATTARFPLPTSRLFLSKIHCRNLIHATF